MKYFIRPVQNVRVVSISLSCLAWKKTAFQGDEKLEDV